MNLDSCVRLRAVDEPPTIRFTVRCEKCSHRLELAGADEDVFERVRLFRAEHRCRSS